jgi:hypothetical protein
MARILIVRTTDIVVSLEEDLGRQGCHEVA